MVIPSVPVILGGSFGLMLILSMAVRSVLKRWTPLGPYASGVGGWVLTVLFITTYATIQSGAVAIVIFPMVGVVVLFAMLLLIGLLETLADRKNEARGRKPPVA